MKGTRNPWKHHSRPARSHEHKGSGLSYLQRNSHSCCVKSEANHRSKEIPIHTSARGGFGFRLRSFRLTEQCLRSPAEGRIWLKRDPAGAFNIFQNPRPTGRSAARRTGEPAARRARNPRSDRRERRSANT